MSAQIARITPGNPVGNYAINTDVPLPPAHKPGERATKYPWPRMEVGHSFFHAGDREHANRAIQAARVWGARNGMRFTSRTVTENGIKGVRIWRVA